MKLNRIRKRKNLELNITPLIDIVFLLLIFFMVATSFDDRRGIKIDLPKSTVKKQAKTIQELRILVDKDKNIYINSKQNNKALQEKISQEEIVSSLSKKLAESEKKEVVISADKSIDYGYIVELMSSAKEAGAEAINIDTTVKR